MKTTIHYSQIKTNTEFYKYVAAIACPMALQYFMNALVSASDALMLGSLNQESLAAVSLAGQITFISNLFFSGFLMGENVMAAQYWGKGKKSSVERVLAIALRFTMLIASCVFLLTFFAPGFLMSLYTMDSQLIALGIPYLRIVSVSYLFNGFSMAYLAIMKNSGRALKSTLYGSSAVVMNVILNAALIYGIGPFPRLGIVGAAIATTISKGIEFLLCIYENLKEARYGNVIVRWNYICEYNKLILKDYIHFTWPSLANQVIWGLAFTMNSVIMGHLGSDATAANAIAQIAKQVAICLCMGLAHGTGILIGNELGRGNLADAKKLGDRLIKLTLCVSAFSGMVLFCVSPIIVRFSGTLSATSASYLSFMLRVCSYYLIGKALSCMLVAGVFSAGGDTRFGLILDTINMWGLIIPLGFLTAFVWKLPVPVVYFFLNLDEFTKMPAEIWYYRKYKWVKNITR